ncbi:thiamine-phosphate kinase [Nocardia stercoris]|uniref:Thiamine-monophosphate kinase n=1 Tax=Nocardia stercoris TaxID=2483361 RepID=A0A3M2LG98_9NOCA|nr:thiamine-phosphate kinase [Nocardia stercoris]
MRELGEFALIARINRGRVQAPDVLVGPGDDAAVVGAPSGRFVVTTDMLVQDRHFRLDWSGPGDIGRKAIAQNAADVVAMGAVPTAFVVALGCPADTPVAFVDELADGLWAEARRAGGSIAGGDLVRSPLLVLSVTAFGDPAGREPVLRSGARPGDVVAVAGVPGRSAAGLAAFVAGRADEPEMIDVVAAHRVPRPPYRAVLDLVADSGIHALTDVSDGLLADLGHIAELSGVAVDLDSATLRDPLLDPVAAALGGEPLAWALRGGEDHAFAATFEPNRPLPPGWRAIGSVGPGHGVTVDGAAWSGSAGWESFSAETGE